MVDVHVIKIICKIFKVCELSENCWKFYEQRRKRICMHFMLRASMIHMMTITCITHNNIACHFVSHMCMYATYVLCQHYIVHVLHSGIAVVWQFSRCNNYKLSLNFDKPVCNQISSVVIQDLIYRYFGENSYSFYVHGNFRA